MRSSNAMIPFHAAVAVSRTSIKAASERNAAALRRLVPQPVAIDVEHKLWIFRYREPPTGRQLALELARTPAGVTERNETLPRTFVVADVAQHLGIGGHRDMTIDGDG